MSKSFCTEYEHSISVVEPDEMPVIGGREIPVEPTLRGLKLQLLLMV